MITILMATYNGAAYLVEQLDSLLHQTRRPDRIIIHDDQSTDSTFEILTDYQSRHPDLIQVRRNEHNSGGSAANFMAMMTQRRDDYIMLCDQDDVWLPDKIELSYAKITAMEAQWGQSTPALMHTDLTIVDQSLRPTAASFKTSTFADYDRTTLRDQIIQNTATGCTIMYNRALADLITVVPRHMVMHDWWISLIAAAFGHMDHIDDCTILYRQHRQNQVGATDMRRLSYKLRRLIAPAGVRTDIAKTYPQAREFAAVFADRLTKAQKDLLAQYCAIPSLGKVRRVAQVIRLGMWKTGFSRNVAYLLFI
ncbi:MAG: glycosyltransferase family 2 protein [Propionibacteriaceae bacterium]|jgi:glycosyltransferase involved in cell wall biosynthesis|nr:glycosyltransferase family 2 protein [Propionibacteriaceae bacterium]